MRLIIIITLFWAFSGIAAELPNEQRPKVGLVLSGGGAKGAAHIGVLKILEQHNVPIDYIVGTSIGAYVGGLYALGYSPEEIENIMLNLPWNESYSDFVPRKSLLYSDQALRDKYNISLRLGYSDNTLKTPSGLLLGQTATQLLRLSTDVIAQFESFDQLAIPYRAVATDLATSKAVVLDSGSITKAMSASAAVPSIVEPVVINNRLLVDGGISNNMPVDVIRKMGAQRIIAVDIGSPLATKDEIKNTIDVLNQLSTILTNNTTVKQVKKLHPHDLYIRPQIDGLSTTDFSIMPQALALGISSANEQLDKVKTFSITDELFLVHLNKRKSKSKAWFKAIEEPITAIDYVNNSTVNNAIIAEHFAINIGDIITKEQLKLAIDRVYALDRFERVDAEFIDSTKGRILQLTTQEKSWGPDFLNFGFSLQTDFSSSTFIAIDAAYILNDVTDNGGQWKNELSIGWEAAVATEFYQPMGINQHLYTRIRAEYAQDKWAQSIDKPELTNQYVQTLGGFGYHYANQGLFEMGVVAESGDLSFKDKELGDIEYISYGGYISLGFDNLNSINFPTSGNKLAVELFWRRDEYQQEFIDNTLDNSLEINLNWRGALGIGNHTFVGIASFATVENDHDFSVHITELGGFLNLSGYTKDALIGNHKAFSAIVYQYDLGRDVPGGSGLPIYLGTSLEVGNVWGNNETVKVDDLINSGSIYLGTDTSFGPAVIGIGYASGGERIFFLSLGKNW